MLPGDMLPGDMLKVSGLRAGYGRIPILGGVTLSVQRGEFVGVLGHNGMGKTTLLKALMGYLPATAGQILLQDHDITRATPSARAQRGLGYVPQGREIFPALSVHENLRMGCLLSPSNERSTIERVLAAFPRLTPLLDRPGGALSGGEQQLLALARCLCGSSAPDPAGRADRGHPAFDRRRNRRHLAIAAGIAQPYDDSGRAGFAVYCGAVGSGADHPEGRHHP